MWQKPNKIKNKNELVKMEGNLEDYLYDTEFVDWLEDKELTSTIKPGDLVNFGVQGNYYIVRERDEQTYFVTSKEEDRFNEDANGFVINKIFAVEIKEKGGN